MLYCIYCRLHPLNQRRRRSGVCSSMPTGKVIGSSPRVLKPIENMDTEVGLPKLQVNGIHCEGDQGSSSIDEV